MRAMSEAIEGARDFQGFMEKIVADEKRLRQQLTQGATPDANGFPLLGQDRQPGENRAAHRARLKAERRAAKTKVAV